MSRLIDRVLDPFTACFTPEVARRVVELRADEEDQSRLDELADKANEGSLTEEEQADYERYRQVFHFVTVLQAKARSVLENQVTT